MPFRWRDPQTPTPQQVLVLHSQPLVLFPSQFAKVGPQMTLLVLGWQVQVYPNSTWQLASHPSTGVVLPSSQVSLIAGTPLPQTLQLLLREPLQSLSTVSQSSCTGLTIPTQGPYPVPPAAHSRRPARHGPTPLVIASSS